MTVYTASDMVLAVARGLLFVRESPRNSNRGPGIKAMLQVTGLGEGYPWCAASVAYCGVTALGDRWPLPRTASCAQLGEAADRLKVLHTQPEPGDVFLVWHASLGRFAHTGFVESVGETVRTLEGNTNDGGSRDGWGQFRRVRRFGPKDRFIRWSEAL